MNREVQIINKIVLIKLLIKLNLKISQNKKTFDYIEPCGLSQVYSTTEAATKAATYK